MKRVKNLTDEEKTPFFRSGPDENEILLDMFPGMPRCHNGYVTPGEGPGLGIDIDEDLALKYPCDPDVTVWTQTRIPDGTVNTP